MPKPNTSFPSVQPFAHFHYLKQQQQLQKQQGGRDADSATGTAVHLSPTADEGSPEEREEEDAGAAMTATTGAFERRGDSILEVGGDIADPIELGATNSGVSTCSAGGLSVRANLLVPS